MGITGRAWRKLAMAAAVPGVALGTLAGFSAPAMASTAQPHVVYSHETFHGFVRGISPYIPIYADGVVSDHGYLNLTGTNPGYIVHLRNGSLYVDYYNSSNSSHIAQQSCNATFSDTVDYTINGGTGNYEYAYGTGTAHVRITAVLYRHNGTCDPSDPIPNTVYTSFWASGPFYPSGL
jgi:hypothetical protein